MQESLIITNISGSTNRFEFSWMCCKKSGAQEGEISDMDMEKAEP